MDKKDLSIATITLARDEQEESLLQDSLQELAKLEVPVFVTDGGSGPGFVDFLKSFPNFIVSKSTVRGVWVQAKNSLSEAYKNGSAFIFYTEPDKLEFFGQLTAMISNVQTSEQTGIIMASRSATGFATFPPFHQMTETTINNCCAEVIGKDFDYTYGPFILNQKLVPYLDLVQEDIGWGWRPYTFGVAKRLGFSVESYTENFCCPPDQREEPQKERVYRMRQLSESIQGIVLSTNVPVNKS